MLSTGRSYPGIRDKNQLGGIRYDYAITCNGACVVDRQGNVIAEHPLTSEEMYVLVDFVRIITTRCNSTSGMPITPTVSTSICTPAIR